MIHVEQISKQYQSEAALKAVSLEVKKGELFGLIGPDGAGKTTLFRILATLLLPDSGTASIGGFPIGRDYRNIRRNVGYMPGKFSLYPDLSVAENLQFFAAIFRTTVQENYDTIRSIYEQLAPFRRRRAGALSGGMKQKLALCCALVHQPEVLLLDEPTTGVDAVSRQEFWDTLGNLREKGITILVSTPYMDEAALCDRIALIESGALLDIGHPGSIIRKFDRPLWAVQSTDTYRLLLDLRQFTATDSCFPFGESVHLTLRDPEKITELAAFLRGKGHQKVHIQRIAASIEDCFMALMKKRPEETLHQNG